jgi:hypothetical protein
LYKPQQKHQQQNQESPAGAVNADDNITPGDVDDVDPSTSSTMDGETNGGDNEKNSSTSSSGSGGAGNSGSNTGAVGSDAWVYQELGEPTLCMHSEITSSQQQQAQHIHSNNGSRRILLRTRILLRDAYQRQGDNIITWCEPYLEEGNPTQGVDLALSFQDNAGCLDIWRQITHVQQRANEMFSSARWSGATAGRNKAGSGENKNNNFGGGSGGGGGGTHSVADMAQAVAAAHHADLQRQDQQEMWVNVASEAAAQHNHYHQQQHHGHHQHSNIPSHHHNLGGNDDNMMDFNDRDRFDDSVGNMVPSYHDSSSPVGATSNLPNPPSLSNLEEIADTIAAVQVCISFPAK